MVLPILENSHLHTSGKVGNMSMFYCSGCDHLVDSDATLFIVEEGKNGVDEWICEPCLERDNPDHAERLLMEFHGY